MWCCVFFVPCPTGSPPAGRSRRHEEVLDAEGNLSHPVKLQNDDNDIRKRGVPCGHLARHISQETLVGSPLFFCNLCHGQVSPQLLNGNDGADCVIFFDKPVKMWSFAGVDGALEPSCGFLLHLKQRSVLCVAFLQCRGAKARVDVPQPHEHSESLVLLVGFMDRRETGWFSREKRRHCLGSSPVRLTDLPGL